MLVGPEQLQTLQFQPQQQVEQKQYHNSWLQGQLNCFHHENIQEELNRFEAIQMNIQTSREMKQREQLQVSCVIRFDTNLTNF